MPTMRRALSPEPLISISVVVFETAMEDLSKFLRGVMLAPHISSVTVVDNSPTQALRPVAESAGAVYLPAGKNLGYGAGHNLAMSAAIQQSAYHLVCNPDIVCGPEVLDALYRFMESNPKVGLVMPKVLYPDGKEQRLCKLLPTPADLFLRRFAMSEGSRLLRGSRDRYELRSLDLKVAREIPSLSGCFMFLRSSVLQKTGLFDPRFFLYMEDVDLCRRVGVVASTVFYPAVSVVHGYAKGSYKNSKLLRFHLASAVRYFNKWGWFHDPVRRGLNRKLAVWADAEPQQHSERRSERSTRTYA